MQSDHALSSALDALVLRAQKPSRYVGGELGSVTKDLSAAGLRFALAFPDTYEVGMSNLGFRLLYHLLNDRPEIACERVFLPWPDLEETLRAERLPLFTLESRAPVRSFDVLGVTLQFELAATSVLALLDLSGIPVLARDRGDADPLVLGGGPCAYNPEPLADFFDAFAVGDGEEVALEPARCGRAGSAAAAPRARSCSGASPASRASTCPRSSARASTAPPARSPRWSRSSPGTSGSSGASPPT
jgi:hypothetical protein